MTHPFSISVKNELELQQLVHSEEHIAVLNFWAPWCTPCHRLEEDLQQIAATYKGKITFLKIDIDALPEVSEAYDIGRIPTLLALRQNLELGRIDGDIPTAEIQNFLDSLVKQN